MITKAKLKIHMLVGVISNETTPIVTPTIFALIRVIANVSESLPSAERTKTTEINPQLISARGIKGEIKKIRSVPLPHFTA